MSNSIKLPLHLWYDQEVREFPLPEGWKTTIHNFAGSGTPELKADQIREAVRKPIGMPPLREYARGKKEAVIIFDDMTRGGRPYQIVPYILEELAEAGFTDDRIRFIAGVANHHAMDYPAMAKKLGKDIVERFAVYNHCPFLNCTEIGTTSYGTKAFINAEVMYCDLKIVVGQILPHVQYGFSGGPKLIVPGVSSYETVTDHHSRTHEKWKAEQREKGVQLIGRPGSPIHSDAMEIARMAGLDMIVNTLTNGSGEIAGIFAGALDAAYPEAVKAASKHYPCENTRDSDIVISNNFTKAGEFNMGLSGMQAIRPEGGSLLLVASSPVGQVIHYLFDRFGKTITGNVSHAMPLPPHVKKLVMYNEYPEAKILRKFVPTDKLGQTDDWQEAIDILTEVHGPEARVAVYPNADTQFFKD